MMTRVSVGVVFQFRCSHETVSASGPFSSNALDEYVFQRIFSLHFEVALHFVIVCDEMVMFLAVVCSTWRRLINRFKWRILMWTGYQTDSSGIECVIDFFSESVSDSFQLFCNKIIESVVKGEKVKVSIVLHGTPISQLQDVTCHMGSHSVTCHPTQVNTPRLNPCQ